LIDYGQSILFHELGYKNFDRLLEKHGKVQDRVHDVRFDIYSVEDKDIKKIKRDYRPLEEESQQEIERKERRAAMVRASLVALEQRNRHFKQARMKMQPNIQDRLRRMRQQQRMKAEDVDV
jgi:uncharacterized protein YdcH (DUF465 family)